MDGTTATAGQPHAIGSSDGAEPFSAVAAGRCADLPAPNATDRLATDLHRSDVHTADVHSADSHDADVHSADSHDADVHSADSHDADVNGAHSHDADVNGAHSHGADPHSVHPDGETASGRAADAPVPESVVRAREALGAIRAGIAELRGVPLWTIGHRELLGLVREVESTLRSGFGVQVRLAGELHERGVADMLDARSAAHLLRETLNVTMAEARARVAAAMAGLPIETATGAVIAPKAPELLEGIDTGTVSDRHSKVITDCLDKIPDAVDPATVSLCRTTLLEQAATRDANGLRHIADQIVQIVDPDGDLSGKDATDRAEFHIGQRRRDGLTPVRGLLDPLATEELRIAIEVLAGPRPVDDGTPDPRPAPLRRAQALAEIMRRHLQMGAGPRDGGVRPQVVVTIGIDDLVGLAGRTGRCSRSCATAAAGRPGAASSAPSNAPAARPSDATGSTGTAGSAAATGTAAPAVGIGARRADPSHGNAGQSGVDGDLIGLGEDWPATLDAIFGAGRTGGAGPVSNRSTGARTGFAWMDYGSVTDPAIARLLACDAQIIPQLLGVESVVLDQGRAVRLFTAAQRRALTTRDKGCAFPGCDIPAAWCESHHIIWWSQGGATDIANGVLLCRRHHVLIHQGRWCIEQDPGGGRPWFIPPAHIDPARKPRRNSHFHLPDLLTTVRRQ